MNNIIGYNDDPNTRAINWEVMLTLRKAIEQDQINSNISKETVDKEKRIYKRFFNNYIRSEKTAA